jgi:hypothetical protein
MGSVRRHGGARSGTVRIELDPAEVAMLASLVGQVRQLLTDGMPEGLADGTGDPLQALIGLRSAETAEPDDPILARLLPAAYRDDDEAAAAYRTLMDTDLRLQKAAALRRVLDDLASAQPRKGGELRIELADDDAAQWLFALTDVRLALGTILGITEDIDAEIASRETQSARSGGLAVYDWLTWLQDATVGAVSPD